MPVPQEQLDEWEAQVDSANMMDVLNAMLAICECEDPPSQAKLVHLLEDAGRNLHSLAKQTKLSLPDGRLTFEEFRQQCLAKVKQAPAPSGKTAAQRNATNGSQHCVGHWKRSESQSKFAKRRKLI
jgi:hypothetical protein